MLWGARKYCTDSAKRVIDWDDVGYVEEQNGVGTEILWASGGSGSDNSIFFLSVC